jgi:hypothetical protein
MVQNVLHTLIQEPEVSFTSQIVDILLQEPEVPLISQNAYT